MLMMATVVVAKVLIPLPGPSSDEERILANSIFGRADINFRGHFASLRLALDSNSMKSNSSWFPEEVPYDLEWSCHAS
jgi:hypothetical protein